MLLENKRAVVTGAANGIGKAIAEVFLDQGAQVIGLDIAPAEADRAGLTLLRADLARPEDCRRAVEEITARWDRVDILVNCAGITRDAMTWRMTEDQWDQVLAVDLKAVWDLTRRIGPLMRKEQAGSIINISSMNAFTPLTKIPAYSGAKAAVSNLTAWLATHFSKVGIRCNAIAPGFFVTAQNQKLLYNDDGTPTERTAKILRNTPMDRFGKPEELLGAIIFLASSEASGFVNGVVLPIDGGFNAYSGV